MANITHLKRRYIRSRLLAAHFYRDVLKSMWLFFPAILFLALAYGIFWQIPQGQDIIALALERKRVEHRAFISIPYALFILGLVFWVYVTWYSTRVVAKAKHFQSPDEDDRWHGFAKQTPRLLAFTCISIVLLAIARLPKIVFEPLGNANIDHVIQIVKPYWSHGLTYLLLIISIPFYFVLDYAWNLLVKKIKSNSTDTHRSLIRWRRLIYFILLAGYLLVIVMQNPKLLLTYIFLLQGGLVLLMIIRHEMDAIRKGTEEVEELDNPRHVNRKSLLFKKFRHIVFDDEDHAYFQTFKLISFPAVCVYLAAIIDIKFAAIIGPCPFLLLAFGVLLIMGNLITVISVFVRLNFHLILFGISMFLGHSTRLTESYKAELLPKVSTAQFNKRQNLREYFLNWLAERKPELDQMSADNSSAKFPVYFVMANGGASRSGYWTASILSGLETGTDGFFSRHLFCLSGASGGSLGTSAFFTMLKDKPEMDSLHLNMSEETDKYFKSDFLTFTMSHMLGPDIFSHIIPGLHWVTLDRATALAHSIEEAPGDDSQKKFFYHKYRQRLSGMITQQSVPYHLPVLCINTTKMQDGKPAVISNIRIKEDSAGNNYFNNRIDVLDLLGPNKDMKLSTAVVLGASFPYLSPAGRIDDYRPDSSGSGVNYFVDGGYFDNSGAGVVNEMIIALDHLLNEDTFRIYRNKLEFYVIHISNTDPKDVKKNRINPVVNDLLSPVRTMIGSYGSQTTVNDQRLKSYLTALYPTSNHYLNFDLYKNDRLKITYSMNWVISRYQMNLMTNFALPGSGYLRAIKKYNTADSLLTSPGNQDPSLH
ncbi:MAG TPA: patatin-like phospholipase family protein [Chitinophagaceae bacterium]|nr:patatin-like phospholipase family protein [Chitinophagaceae bacterium]